MKKILFIINTLGKAGAEVALMELLKRLTEQKEPDGQNTYAISLFVLTGQGEMIKEVPERVKILNKKYKDISVLSKEGRKYLTKTVMKSLWKRGNLFRFFPYLSRNLLRMMKDGSVKADKLLWRVISDGADRFEENYDLAVAYLEGGSTYYLADHVKAQKKAAFVHVDYSRAGYTRALDKNAYSAMDRIFAVSNEVKETFLHVYPECKEKMYVFHNLIDIQKIRKMAGEGEGFRDDFQGLRLLTVGRLEKQKALEVSVSAMKILKQKGICARWYVLGEGSERKALTEEIEKARLSQDFILCGAVENPYPYMAQADIYVHASRFEGKSIAIQEAQVLGKPMIVSDCSGNREQVTDGVNGLMTELDAEKIAENIEKLINNQELRKELGDNAAKLKLSDDAGTEWLTELIK